MNSEQFINYLKQPGLLDDKSIDELYELIKEFPYFQTAYLLFIKNLHNQDIIKYMYHQENIRYNTQLKITAAYISDRKILYHLLNNLPAKSYYDDIAQEQTIIQQDEAHPPTPSHLSRTAGREREGEDTTPKKEYEETEKNILPCEIASHTPDYSGGISQGEPSQKKESIADIVLKKIVEIKKARLQNPPDCGGGQVKQQEKTIPMHRDETKKIIDSKIKTKTYKELIDNFIRNEPKIEVQKINMNYKEDISRNTTKKYEEYITETLAKVYIKQTYYSKAINIYKKLILKYPKKNIYFAQQIEIIEKLNSVRS